MHLRHCTSRYTHAAPALPCTCPAPPSRRGKELKRKTLLELVDYVNSQAGQRVFTEAVMPDVMDMIVRAAGWC